MKKLAVMLVILAGVLWGSSAIFSNVLSPMGFAPIHMTTMRSTVSALVIFTYILFLDKSLFKTNIKHMIWYMLAGITTFSAAFFYYESISASSVPVAVMLMYTAPVFVIIFSVAFLGEKLTPTKVSAILVMLAGCALITNIFGGAKFSTWGVCAGLLASLTYGSYSIVTKIEMNKKIHPLTASFYCFLTTTVISVLVGDIPGIVHIAASAPLKSYLLMLGIGICTMSLPYFLYTIGLSHIPAGVASALSIVEPLTATFFAVVFFDDPLSITSALGMLMVIGSVIALGRVKS